MSSLQFALGALGWFLAAVWIVRCVRGGLSYRRTPRIRTRPPPSGAPLVSILVPAKNEERNIRECLGTLLGQDYPSIEVIAIDDGSTDRTGDLIEEAARADGRLVGLKASPTPNGWTGKNWALSLGARRARGDWLLFTDADTRHGKTALSSAISHALERGLEFLSLTPGVLAGSFWERTLQPAALGYLGLWFPLDRVNDSARSEAFANGQYLLFRRGAYEALGGHSAVREAYLEDVAFARGAKEREMRFEFALGKRQFRVRMYDSFGRYFRGWHRIYLHAFDRRPGILLLRALDVALLTLLPYGLFLFLLPPAIRSGSAASLSLLAGSGLAVFLIQIFSGKIHSTVGETMAYSLLHPVAALTLLGILLAAARAAWTGAPTRWR